MFRTSTCCRRCVHTWLRLGRHSNPLGITCNGGNVAVRYHWKLQDSKTLALCIMVTGVHESCVVLTYFGHQHLPKWHLPPVRLPVVFLQIYCPHIEMEYFGPVEKRRRPEHLRMGQSEAGRKHKSRSNVKTVDCGPILQKPLVNQTIHY